MEQLAETLQKGMEAGFFSTFLLGLLIHMPIMLRDIPNHDGLASMYFDQNMITSGRWFLTVACGISSYYTLPWLIGLLAMLYLGIAAVLLVEFLEVRQGWAAVLVGGLLAVFPSLASTFAYVFTMDGYMLAVLLAVLAVLLTKKYRLGFLPGALCLACSLGIYQSYLPFAVLLCLYGLYMIGASENTLRDKVKKGFPICGWEDWDWPPTMGSCRCCCVFRAGNWLPIRGSAAWAALPGKAFWKQFPICTGTSLLLLSRGRYL